MSIALQQQQQQQHDEDDENAQRRADEWQALQAVYEGDEQVSLFQQQEQPQGGKGNDGTAITIWTIQLDRTRLQFTLPTLYPSQSPPTDVSVYAPHVAPERLQSLQKELQGLWTMDTEVALLWTEHVRQAIDGMGQQEQQQQQEEETKAKTTSHHTSDGATSTLNRGKTVITHVPSTAKYGQPIRTFPSAVIMNPVFRREIFRGEPFHPPKSGPAETMQAFCATVTCDEHVQWMWAELLLNEPKVAKASHNMVAYRYVQQQQQQQQGNKNTNDNNNTTRIVSDNDDDGEKGAGAKLAALLEMSRAQNVMVMVSRWYGGVHLGPARFKWIAHTARQALQQGQFLPTTTSSTAK